MPSGYPFQLERRGTVTFYRRLGAVAGEIGKRVQLPVAGIELDETEVAIGQRLEDEEGVWRSPRCLQDSILQLVRYWVGWRAFGIQDEKLMRSDPRRPGGGFQSRCRDHRCYDQCQPSRVRGPTQGNGDDVGSR